MKHVRFFLPSLGELFERAEVSLRLDHLIERVPHPEIVLAEVLAGVAVVDEENVEPGGLMVRALPDCSNLGPVNLIIHREPGHHQVSLLGGLTQSRVRLLKNIKNILGERETRER